MTKRRRKKRKIKLPLVSCMQQYFTKEPLETGKDYIFTKEQEHHIKDVLHLNRERVRLVYQNKAFFAETFYDGGTLKAHILSEDEESHDLPVSIRLIMSLIRREKFELVLQKAAELGVNELIPLRTERCVVTLKKEKQDRIHERWQAILQEAAEQCKRNSIPVLKPAANIKELDMYTSGLNVIPYEKQSFHSKYISDLYDGKKSVSIVIGPEGGFTDNEIDQLTGKNYIPVSLGARILRAETAAVYACSICAEAAERRRANEVCNL